MLKKARQLDHALNVTVEIEGFNRCPALHYAAYCGNVNIVRYILSLGVPVDTVTAENLYTAQQIAACEGHLDVVRCLIEADADINAKSNTGMTPLHCASWFGNVEVVRFLIESNADGEGVWNYTVSGSNSYASRVLGEVTISNGVAFFGMCQGTASGVYAVSVPVASGINEMQCEDEACKTVPSPPAAL